MRATKELKTNKGITLIALVITIIVMLILVAVSITMAVNGGLFEQAGKATAKTNNALIAEGQLAEGGVKVGENTYSSIDEYLIASGNKVEATEPVEPISKEKSYVGCYADIDGVEGVDGIIYADLAFTTSRYGAITAEELKDYYVSGTYDGDFNEEGEPKEVIKATGTGGEKDRFYVMALEDFGKVKRHCWYYSASGNGNTEIVTEKEFGTGKTNTITMIQKWNASAFGAQNAEGTLKDIWGSIQDSEEYDVVENVNDSGKWFVPSILEWAEFVRVFGIAEDCNENYGLSTNYWSSSQIDSDNADYWEFASWCAGAEDITLDNYVRLSTTF